MNFNEYNTLGTIINDTFGQTQEAVPGYFKTIARIRSSLESDAKKLK